jgi:hypothetical protein
MGGTRSRTRRRSGTWTKSAAPAAAEGPPIFMAGGFCKLANILGLV